MKQLDLIRKLTSEHSVVFVRHGGDHDWYRNVVTGHREAIRRERLRRGFARRSQLAR